MLGEWRWGGVRSVGQRGDAAERTDGGVGDGAEADGADLGAGAHGEADGCVHDEHLGDAGSGAEGVGKAREVKCSGVFDS